MFRLIKEHYGLDTAILKSWKAPYIGQYHELLYSYLCSLNRDKPYSNVVPFVQSSGTGKSRLVHELGRLVFTIPFNLRGNNSGGAYPPTDKAIVEALRLRQGFSSTVDALWAYAEFFRRLFHTIRMVVTAFESVDEYNEFVQQWHCFLESHREELYDKATEHLDRSVRIFEQHEKSQKKTLLDQKISEMITSLLDLQTALGKRVKNQCSLPGNTNTDTTRDPVKIVICIDEAQALAKATHEDKTKNSTQRLLDLLCTVTDVCRGPKEGGLSMVLVSTNSIIAKTALKVAMGFHDESHELAPMFTEIPFDCHPEFPIRPANLHLQDLSKIRFMVRFGRPLFWTMLEHTYESRAGLELLSIAEMKLILHEDYKSRNLSAEAGIAVLDVRLALDYEPAHEAAREMQAKLIESHMRLAYSMPFSRDYLRSGYSSEPFLAEAAAQLMRKWSMSYAFYPFYQLENIALKGLLDETRREDLVARCLATVAYDNAIAMERKTIYSEGCQLTTFIKELFSDTALTKILWAEPANIPSGTLFKKAFAHSVVRFTHWAKLGADVDVNTHMLYSAFIRGMAFCGRINSGAICLFIPILLHKGAALREQAITALVIQIGRARSAAPIASYDVDIDLFPEEENQKQRSRPYITIVMELGFKHPLEAASPNTSSSKNSQKRKEQSRTVSPEPIDDTPLEHPRYSFRARGCSNDLYRNIDEGRYRNLLGTRDLDSRHPLHNAETIRTMLDLKSTWLNVAESYSWVETGIERDGIESQLQGAGTEGFVDL